jgi:hypothetical protein
VGATELARKGVLVTRLSACEDAATMDVLRVDKTAGYLWVAVALGLVMVVESLGLLAIVRASSA